MKKRSQDEMEFEDEVDYPADIPIRDRFKKYKGLKNFKTSEWNKNVKIEDISKKNTFFDLGGTS